MRILITNNTLADRAGTELYVRDIAMRLRELGHEPVAWSIKLGAVAAELRRLGVPVVDDLAQLPFHPDLIHGQHHLETMTALQYLPGVPAVYFCHGAVSWEEAPPLTPRIQRYVAVDLPCLERILERGVPAGQTAIHLNFVDLPKFQPRPPLPARPRRALVFSNYARKNETLRIIRRTCARAGLTLDVVGAGFKNATATPEKLLPHYDLVFAKGRAALEALAVGCSVIVWHDHNCGPLVTAREFDHQRQMNFGFRLADQLLTPDFLAGQIARYDAADAAIVCQRVRAEAGLNQAVDRLLRLYETVLAEHKLTPPDAAAAAHAAGIYWQGLVPLIKRAPKSIPAPARRRLSEKLARKADKLARWLRT